MAQDDLAALLARLKDMPAGATVQVIIPRGQPVTLADGIHYDADLYEIPSSLFAQPAAAQLPPPKGDDTPQQERFMVATATLNIRAEPNRNAVLRGMLATGERVAVTGSATNGYVALAGDKGWVLESGLNT